MVVGWFGPGTQVWLLADKKYYYIQNQSRGSTCRYVVGLTSLFCWKQRQLTSRINRVTRAISCVQNGIVPAGTKLISFYQPSWLTHPRLDCVSCGAIKCVLGMMELLYGTPVCRTLFWLQTH